MLKPYFHNGFATLYQADARQLPIPNESVDCVVTSPPYYNLRDYGVQPLVWGGSSGCAHSWVSEHIEKEMRRGINLASSPASTRGGAVKAAQIGRQSYDVAICRCGAWLGTLGLEPTPEEYCANIVAVFREVWRVLKPTGTVWLNLGDSYSDKQLVGIPWRVAFALQADGWYLRSDIIWSKLNPMPEPVQDRPTKAHEYVFLLTKSSRYYYDADAIRETHIDWERGAHGEWVGSGDDERPQLGVRTGTFNAKDRNGAKRAYNSSGRNKRTVWEIATQPYPEAHFATYPEKLVEPCILGGTSERGVCAECGKPWERIVDKERSFESGSSRSGVLPQGKNGDNLQGGGATIDIRRGPVVHTSTLGWQPTCECNANTVPATVLDPFVGSGTTLAVAQRLGRKGIGTDLNEEYLQLASDRITEIPLPLVLM